MIALTSIIILYAHFLLQIACRLDEGWLADNPRQTKHLPASEAVLHETFFFQPGAHHIQSRTADAWSERDATTTRTPAPSYRQPNLVKHLARPPHHVNPMRVSTQRNKPSHSRRCVPRACPGRRRHTPKEKSRAPPAGKKRSRAHESLTDPASLAPGPATQGRT